MTLRLSSLHYLWGQMQFRFLCLYDRLSGQAPPEESEEVDIDCDDNDPFVWAEEHADEDDLENEEEDEADC